MVSCAFVLYGCGDTSGETGDGQELSAAKAEAAAAKAENSALRAEMAASGNDDDSPADKASQEKAAATATTTPKPAAEKASAKAAGAAKSNGKYRTPTVDEIAQGANANCDVEIEAYSYRGPCRFDSHGGASFTIARADGYPMSSQFEEVIVEADTNKIAMMSIRDSSGNLEGIGQVSRESTRNACWTGYSTKVCAYAKSF